MEIENLAIKKFVKENLKKKNLTITVISGIFSIIYTKKNGKLRIYINYRQLNSIIKKD